MGVEYNFGCNEVPFLIKDIVTGPAYIPPGSRPSVLSINTNNRGMVKQRVNLFAKLGTQRDFMEQVGTFY